MKVGFGFVFLTGLIFAQHSFSQTKNLEEIERDRAYYFFEQKNKIVENFCGGTSHFQYGFIGKIVIPDILKKRRAELERLKGEFKLDEEGVKYLSFNICYEVKDYEVYKSVRALCMDKGVVSSIKRFLKGSWKAWWDIEDAFFSVLYEDVRPMHRLFSSRNILLTDNLVDTLTSPGYVDATNECFSSDLEKSAFLLGLHIQNRAGLGFFIYIPYKVFSLVFKAIGKVSRRAILGKGVGNRSTSELEGIISSQRIKIYDNLTRVGMGLLMIAGGIFGYEIYDAYTKGLARLRGESGNALEKEQLKQGLRFLSNLKEGLQTGDLEKVTSQATELRDLTEYLTIKSEIEYSEKILELESISHEERERIKDKLSEEQKEIYLSLSLKQTYSIYHEMKEGADFEGYLLEFIESLEKVLSEKEIKDLFGRITPERKKHLKATAEILRETAKDLEKKNPGLREKREKMKKDFENSQKNFFDNVADFFNGIFS